MGFDTRSTKKTASSVFLRPDRVWLASMRKFSKGAFKTDKIFDNNFEATDFELDVNMSFTISPQFLDDKEEDEKIIQQRLQIDIHDLIEISNSRGGYEARRLNKAEKELKKL